MAGALFVEGVQEIAWVAVALVKPATGLNAVGQVGNEGPAVTKLLTAQPAEAPFAFKVTTFQYYVVLYAKAVVNVAEVNVVAANTFTDESWLSTKAWLVPKYTS